VRDQLLRHGVNVVRPKALVIIGVADNFPPSEKRILEQDLPRQLKLFTYDELARMAKQRVPIFTRHFLAAQCSLISRCAGFGIQYLDDLLAEGTDGSHGLPFGSISAIVSDPVPEANNLKLAFLMNLFAGSSEPTRGIALFISTRSLDVSILVDTFARSLSRRLTDGHRSTPRDEIAKRLVCRTLIPLHLTPDSILATLHNCFSGLDHRALANSRVLIDDISQWKHLRPNLQYSPDSLSSVFSYLRETKVTALVGQSYLGSAMGTSGRFDLVANSLVDHQIYSWPVQFYGEERRVVAPIPPLSSELGPVIRELRSSRDGPDDLNLEVDPHFELYSGLEIGKPAPVPLRIVLEGTTEADQVYVHQSNEGFNQLFEPFSSPEMPGASVIVSNKVGQISIGRENKDLNEGTRLNHTLVMQLGLCRKTPPNLHSLENYLESTVWNSGKSEPFEDPFMLFRPLSDEVARPSRSLRRVDFLEKKARAALDSARVVHGYRDRVPYAWDVTFLLCDPSLWIAAEHRTIPLLPDIRKLTVGDIWRELPKAESGDDGEEDSLDCASQNEHGQHNRRPSWRHFLGACKEVVEHNLRRRKPRTTALGMGFAKDEAIATTLLEIWASEVYERVSSDRLQREEFFQLFAHDASESNGRHQSKLLRAVNRYRSELYNACLLLAELLAFQSIVRSSPTGEGSVPNRQTSVAVRHCYRSACTTNRADQLVGRPPLLVVGLPGHFATRFDSYLGIEAHSRSFRTGYRALDLLLSRRANFDRLRLGIGLPIRDCAPGMNSQLTALATKTTHGNTAQVKYYDLCHISGIESQANEEFFSLPLSALLLTEREVRVWLQWSKRVLRIWNGTLAEGIEHRANNCMVYDRIKSYREFNPVRSSMAYSSIMDSVRCRWLAEDHLSWQYFQQTWGSFDEMCNRLFARLS
jgi:hypothetical protein